MITPKPATEQAMLDTFRGDNAHLVQSIEALLELNTAEALWPHGIGGHAAALLASAAVRLSAPQAGPASTGEPQ
jgi:hypothetical protein